MHPFGRRILRTKVEDDIVTPAWPALAGGAIRRSRADIRASAVTGPAPDRLGALASILENAPMRHRVDQQLGQPPHQRIETIRRVACASPIITPCIRETWVGKDLVSGPM